MRYFLAVVIAAVFASTPATAKGGGSHGGGAHGTGSNPSSHGVSGYTNSRGKYVAPHQQTNPNNTQRDNYNSRGNYNPSTGKTGHQTPKY